MDLRLRQHGKLGVQCLYRIDSASQLNTFTINRWHIESADDEDRDGDDDDDAMGSHSCGDRFRGGFGKLVTELEW